MNCKTANKRFFSLALAATSIWFVGCSGGGSSSLSSSSTSSSISSSSASTISSSPSPSSSSSSPSPSSSSSSPSPSSSSSSPSSSSVGLVTSGDLVVAVNAGGNQVTVDGINYQADKFSRGGMANSTMDPIAGTDDDGLYQTERYGKFSYEVPVSKSTYDVELHFSELYQTTAGSRAFSVTVEGQAVFSDLDLYTTAGHDTAYSRVIKNVAVSDGSLSITLTATTFNATISGFAIYSEQGVLKEPTFPIVKATNPNIWADVPDMSVIRVGDTYYMSSTTMHLSPGVPIMKSKDLKNWEVINYAYQKLGPDNNAMNLNGANAYSRGTWASSLSHRDGVFYVSSFSYTTGKTYVWTTTNFEGGSWTEHKLKEANGKESGAYHDSSLFFDDDGKVYLAHAPGGNISILELTSDATAVKAGATDRRVVQNAHEVAARPWSGGLTAEGTQMQKINGWYYISNICWPTGKPRTQIVHRSRNIYGPYEGRVVLSDGTAQGRFVDTPSGDWYLYAFKDSNGVGRVPYLVPITWQNDWPTASGTPQTLPFDVEDRGIQGVVRSDEFASPGMDLVWQWNHNPDDNGWSLSQRAGYLRITNRRTDGDILSTRNTLTQRMFGPTSTGIVKLDTTGMKNGDVAGISAFNSAYGLVGVRVVNGQKSVVMISGDKAGQREVERIGLNQATVYLRVRGDFRNRTDMATFSYSLDGNSWNAIGNSTKMNFDVGGHFMGSKFGLFNYGTQNTDGYADFDFFHVSE